MAQTRPYGHPPRDQPPDDPSSEDPATTAAYIAELTRELAGMARRSRLEIVAHLLEMAELEAMDAIGPHGRPTPSRPET